jgi:hypothetical protein
MTPEQLSLFARETRVDAPTKSRKRRCGRDPETGPGSCHHWWDSCPKSIPDCYSRQKQALIRSHFSQGEHHPVQREKSPAAAPFVEALGRLHDRQRGLTTVEPSCISCGCNDASPSDWRWASFEPRICSNCNPKGQTQ